MIALLLVAALVPVVFTAVVSVRPTAREQPMGRSLTLMIRVRGLGCGVRTAVVGHLEWIEFGHLERVPRAGDVGARDRRLGNPAGAGRSPRSSSPASPATAPSSPLGDDERGA